VQRQIALVIGMMLMAPVARAQPPATSFADLRSYVSIGETVFVTNPAGKIVKGKVQRISDTILFLQSGSHDLALPERDVQRVARRGHTLRNGALIGLAAGFVAGAGWAASQPCSVTCFSSTGGVLAFGGLFGSIGLGTGAVVGVSLRRDYVVFERATGSVRAVMSSPQRNGLLASIGW
jgi:hypothetical protein